MFVAFIDLLGFTSQIEALTEIEALHFEQIMNHAVIDAGEPLLINHTGENVQRLYRTFTSFQSAVRRSAYALAKSQANSTLPDALRTILKNEEPDLNSPDSFRVVSFSDSVFLAADSQAAIFNATGELVSSLLMKGIPARAGIAYGTFLTMPWTQQSGKSHFTAFAPFLGTGVLRAYSAESKGPRGIRILIHKSCIKLLELSADDLIKLPNDEVTPDLEFEMNYLKFTGYTGDLTLVNQVLSKMESGAPASIVARHYDPTRQALSRMLEAKSRDDTRDTQVDGECDPV